MSPTAQMFKLISDWRKQRIEIFYFLFLKFMLVELILAACTEYGRPTFSSYLAADKCNE